MNTQHTPTPWDVIEARSGLCHVETALDNPHGAGFPVCSIPAKRRQDAAFIVRACNAHDELVALLTDAHRALGGAHIPGLPSKIRAALANVGDA